MKIRDISLFVEVVGQGAPLLLMHGGPGADHCTLQQFRRLADRFTLVFYDHRCNGRSVGAPVDTMTFENLTADADAIREHLGFEEWAVLGHSFGGHVALEYALRYPDRVSRLVLLDTGGDSHWARDNAPRVLEERGFDPKTVHLVRRFFTGQVEPNEFLSALARLGDAYHFRKGLSLGLLMLNDLAHGEWRCQPRGEPLVQAGRVLMNGWSVVDRLGEIRAPTLVIAGRDDFVFPPECQAGLATGIPNAHLRLVDRAGHNPHSEQTAEVMKAVRSFLVADAGAVVAGGRAAERSAARV
jgi:proline iminopeptidase